MASGRPTYPSPTTTTAGMCLLSMCPLVLPVVSVILPLLRLALDQQIPGALPESDISVSSPATHQFAGDGARHSECIDGDPGRLASRRLISERRCNAGDSSLCPVSADASTAAPRHQGRSL